jgi:hypothetical protein
MSDEAIVVRLIHEEGDRRYVRQDIFEAKEEVMEEKFKGVYKRLETNTKVTIAMGVAILSGILMIALK